MSAQRAVTYFVSVGWTPAQAAGIAANLQAESNWRVDAVGDGGQAYGVAQWHAPRQADFARALGKPIQGSTLDEQLAFVQWELTNTEKRAGDALRACTTAAEAGACVSMMYERPRDREGEARKRAALATQIAEEFAPLEREPRADAPTATQPSIPPSTKEPRMPAPLIPIAISVLQGLLPQVLGLFSQRAQATIVEKTGTDPQLAAQFMQGVIQKVGDAVGVPVTDGATAQLAAAKLVVDSKTPEGSEKVKALEADTLDYLHDLTVAMKDVVEIYGQEVKIETASADAASTRANTGRAGGEADMAAPLVYGALALIGALVVFTFGVAITQIVMLQTRSPTTEVWAAITGLIGFATGVVTTIYAYRFGTSKGSGAKDILIGEMARRDANKGA